MQEDINIKARQHNERYGNVSDLSVQGKYKSYKDWMLKNRPDQQILSFKEWIKWAQDKGLVDKQMIVLHADGENQTTDQPKNYAKIIGISVLAAITVTVIIVVAVNFNKNKT